MPYTKESALQKALKVQAALALSKLRLFKSSFVPSVNSVKADFVAAECDYDGYTAGGATITAMLAPFYDPAGGASVVSPLVYFAWTLDTDAVANLVGGWWLELAAGPVWAYTQYPAPIAMAAAGDAIPQVISFTEGANP